MSILVRDVEVPSTGHLDLRVFPDGMAVRATGVHPFYTTHEVVQIPEQEERVKEFLALVFEDLPFVSEEEQKRFDGLIREALERKQEEE